LYKENKIEKKKKTEIKGISQIENKLNLHSTRSTTRNISRVERSLRKRKISGEPQ